MDTKKRIQIIDIDDTICYTSTKWIRNAAKHPAILKHMDHASNFTIAMVDEGEFVMNTYMRTEYDLLKFMEVHECVQELFISAYKDDGSFYDDIILTNFGRSLKLGGIQNKLVFMTHCIGGLCDLSKKAMIEREFKGHDYDYVEVPLGKSKADVALERYKDFETFIDDCPAVLIDVLNKFYKEEKMIAYPAYGYNASMPIMAKKFSGGKFSLRAIEFKP